MFILGENRQEMGKRGKKERIDKNWPFIGGEGHKRAGLPPPPSRFVIPPSTPETDFLFYPGKKTSYLICFKLEIIENMLKSFNI